MSKTLLNRLLLAVVIFNLCAIIGCHRGYYRRQADAEARRLIREKSVDPRWDSASGEITIDPQSRMFDPFSADHPPIPPDDPASHQFMHEVDCKEGYPQWHANGDTNFNQNPQWQSFLPVNEDGQVVLTLDRAFQLALLHSPDYQEQRETLYLSALDVSLDRFGFDTQLFAGFNNFLTTQGRFRGPGGRSSTTVQSGLGVNGGGVNFERLGITGANFAVGLANTILFNFAGPDTQSATSLIDFSIIQPLLRGAGRDRIMESLTQAERTLLANVRAMERFRRAFYLEVTIGRSSSGGPNRGGNFLGLPGSPSSSAGGYFGLLEQQQRIRNQELNVRQLEAVLELFREFFLRERLDAVQLKQFETSVYRQQRTLLDLKTSYQTSLDRFKLTLGIPPDIDVVIDDSYLDRFELISDQVNERLIAIGALREETGAALNRVDDLFDSLNSPDQLANGEFPWPNELAQRIKDLIPYLDKADATLEKIAGEDMAELESDFRKLDSHRDERLNYLKSLQTAIQQGEIISDVDPGLFRADSIPSISELRADLAGGESVDSIDSRMASLKTQLADIRAKILDFPRVEKDVDRKAAYEYILNEFQEKIPGELSEMNNLMLELSLLQAQARSNSIEIIDVDIKDQNAIEIARCMRRDWMNARASLVDQWRNIEFVADQLESQLDLVFEGDIGNTGDNPFKLRYETGQLRAGLRFDAPIVRMSERNDYREALIDYQQSKRQYYQYEDNVKRILREIIRNLNRNKVLFELDRRTVQVEIENVEINRYRLEEPVGPNASSTRLGATTAQNLTNAIIGLNGAQNSFLRSWVEYEVLRRNLDFDMGTMQLNAAGEWIDPGKITMDIGYQAAAMMGIELNCQFCEGVVSPLGEPVIVDQTGAAMAPNSGGMPRSVYDQPASRQLPYEIEPASEVPLEVEGRIIPDAPRLNEPETGMLRRSTNPRVPNLLFKQVEVKSASKRAPQPSASASTLSEAQQPTASTVNVDQPANPDQATAKTAPANASDSTPEQSNAFNTNPPNPFAKFIVPKHEIGFQIRPRVPPTTASLSAATLNVPIQLPTQFSANPTAAGGSTVDRTLNPFDNKTVTQASTTGEVAATTPFAQPVSLETAMETERIRPVNASPQFTLQAASGNRESQSYQSSQSFSQSNPGNWQSQKSSLGGVLSRFRTQAPAPSGSR